MTRRIVRLVRHGRAAAGWDRDPDPDLDALGRRQAAEVADRLVELGASTVVSSPLLRCRATATRFAERVDAAVVVAPEVAEIPSPDGVAMADRVNWLRCAMAGRWVDLDDRYRAYRDGVVDRVAECADGTVVFSHFVAINAVIGACLGDDRLVIRRLDNCSITTVAVGDDGPVLLESGREADTLIR